MTDAMNSKEKVGSAFLVFGYWALYAFHSGLLAEHFFLGVLALALAYSPLQFSKWKSLFLPLVFTVIVYDSQRLYSDFLRGPIHVLEPYTFDLNVFGISDSGSLFTPNEWLQKRTTPFLDFFTGFAYLFFIPEFFLVAGYFLFSKHEKTIRLAREMTWGFFWLNVLGYSTYYWYAAAPPWYVSDYGLVLADLNVRANLAGCARFDEILGIPIFKTWYGNSADVFGSIPSLHVAYPFLALIYSFKVRRLRVWSTFFYLWVAFAAVYLNHHYILDVLWGTAYAALIGFWSDIFRIRPANA